LEPLSEGCSNEFDDLSALFFHSKSRIFRIFAKGVAMKLVFDLGMHSTIDLGIRSTIAM